MGRWGQSEPSFDRNEPTAPCSLVLTPSQMDRLILMTVHFGWPSTLNEITYLQKILVKSQEFNVFEFCTVSKLLKPIEKHKSQKLDNNSCHKMEYLASSDSPRENSEFGISLRWDPRTAWSPDRDVPVSTGRRPWTVHTVRGSLSLIIICSDCLFYRCVDWPFKFLERAFLTLSNV